MTWLDQLQLDAIEGDIVASDTEAFVCSVTRDLGAYGGISRHLFALGGETLADTVKRAREMLPGRRLALSQAVAISPDGIADLARFRKIIFAALWDRENPYTRNLLYQVFINSLRRAFEHDLSSLAVPILKVDRSILGPTLLSVLRDLDGLRRSKDFPLERLIFVSKKGTDVQWMREQIRDL